MSHYYTAQRGVLEEKVTTRIMKLRQNLNEYKAESILSIDKMGLLHKLLTHLTYIFQNENSSTFRETNAMQSKDCIPSYVSTKALETKFPLSSNDKDRIPSYFRIARRLVPYSAQGNARMHADAVTSSKWFYDVFVPILRRFALKKFELLLDNCGPHCVYVKYCREQIEIFTMPPNFLSIRQPMNMGVPFNSKNTLPITHAWGHC